MTLNFRKFYFTAEWIKFPIQSGYTTVFVIYHCITSFHKLKGLKHIPSLFHKVSSKAEFSSEA